MTSYLELHGSNLIHKGYDIIPIKKGFKHPKGLKNWQKIKATETDITVWLGNGFSDGGVGSQTEKTPGVDIDVNDKDIAEKVVIFTENLVGKTIKRVGMPPRILLLFRTEEPFSKMSSATYEDFLGLRHKVEILGKGQQCVIFGIHPKTKKPYIWIDDKSPANINWEDLPILTQAQAQAIVDYFESIIPADWVKVANGQSSRETSADPFENYKRPIEISTAKIEKTLSLLNPDKSYEHWVKTGMALYHQFGGDAEGLQLWDEWSSTGGKYRSGETSTKWSSFKANLKNTNPVTFSSVIRWAKKERKKEKSKGSEWIQVATAMKKIGAINWTVKGFIETNTIGLFFGDPGSYKSFLALDMALHCATGKEWHGHPVKQGLVMYVAGEGYNGLLRRASAWMKHHKLNLEDTPLYLSKQAVDLYNAESAERVTESINAIAESEGMPRLIVIDTLARNFGDGDENSTSDMNVFIKHVDQYLRVPYECTVLIVHHTGHQHKQRARGAMALKGGVDFEYRIERDGLQGAKVICTKMKDAEEPEDIFFQGQSVLIDIVEDEEISSLVFEKTSAPVMEDKPLKGKQKDLYDLLISLTEEKEWVARELFKDVAIDQNICTEDTFRQLFQRMKQKGFIEEEAGRVKPVELFSK